MKKNKIKFQKLIKDRIVIWYGSKIVDVISQSELIKYLENETLDIEEFESK